MNKRFIVVLLCLFSLNVSQGLGQPFLTNYILQDSVSVGFPFNLIHGFTDIDNDGDKDYYNYLPGEGLSWYDDIQDQTGKTLIANTDFSQYVWVPNLTFIDINNDTLKDIVYLHNNSIKVQENLDNGNYGYPLTISDTINFNQVVNLSFSDIDGNNYIDIVVNRSNEVILYKNQGANNFTDTIVFSYIPANINSLPSPPEILRVRLADLDGDTDLDMVTTSGSSLGFTNSNTTVHIHINNGNGTFLTEEIFEFTVYSPYRELYTWDIDGDDDIDIVFGNNGIGYLENIGNTSFSNYQVISPINGQLNYADINGDDKSDFVLNHYYSNELVWYNNLDSGNYSMPVDVSINLSNTGHKDLRFYDVDQDGDIDLVTHHSQGGVAFLENLLITNQTYLYDTLSLCDESYTSSYSGTTWNTTGTYIDTISIDSFRVLTLFIFSSDTVNLVQSICQGEHSQIGDSTYTSAGYYTNVLENQFGCDSIVNLNLSVVPNTTYHTDTVYTTDCSVVINHNTYFTNTIFTDTLQSHIGCDSIVAYTVIFTPILQPQNNYEHRKITLGAFVKKPRKLLAVDFDNDLDIDIISTSIDNQVVLMEATGNNHYKHLEIPTAFTNIDRIEKVDYDNDGDSDLLVTMKDTCLLGLIRNDACHFTDVIINPCIRDFDIGDLDTNGVEDIVFVDNTNRIKAIYNGIESIDYGQSTTSLYTCKIKDYNGDGLVDIIVRDNLSLNVYTNLGNKNISYEVSVILEYGNIWNLELEDMDNDGDLDIVYFKREINEFGAWYTNLKLAYVENNWVDSTVIVNTSYSFYNEYERFRIGDFYGSSLNDILLISPEFKANPSYITIFHNEGDGEFDTQSLFGEYSVTYYQKYIGDAIIEDINQDGFQDVLYSINPGIYGSIENSLVASFISTGNNTFNEQHISNTRGVSVSVKQGENDFFTHMGPLVHVSGVYSGGYQHAYNITIDQHGGVELNIRPDLYNLNHWGGTIQESANGMSKQVDFDQDGDLDILIGNIHGRFTSLVENHGNLGYIENTSLNDVLKGIDHVFEDKDQDGDIDILFENGIAWRENLGGTYGPLEDLYTWSRPDFSRILELTDLDSDGDKDVIVGINVWSFPVTEIQIFENNGQNQLSFVQSISTTEYLNTFDIDQDGDQDLILDSTWVENQGNLNFTSHNYPQPIVRPQKIMDVNGDGYLDILCKYGTTISWFLDDGTLDFDVEERMLTSNAEAYLTNLSLVDYDNDGDWDIKSVVENGTYNDVKGGLFIYENLENPPLSNRDKDIENEYIQSSFKIYPNPNQGMFVIQSLEENVQLIVSSILGKPIEQIELEQGGNKINFDKKLPSGIYVLTFFKNNTFVESKRVLIR